tara:strand:+ start:3517 stop:4770 length:1254 start_codon:yes stop_codon:yes gene_type:complete
MKLLVKKSKPLNGYINIGGSKNSALPIMAASLLTSKKCLLKNIPDLADINTMLILLKSLGLDYSYSSDHLLLKGSKKLKNFANYELVRKMRASILVLGPLLARTGSAKVSLPGGCAIGTRPIDLHLYALQKLGANIKIKNGYVYAEAKQGLKGNKIKFLTVSVGATENAVLASVIAKGKTIIENAAREPEVQDLCNFLNVMGAKISNIGKKTIIIEGVKNLKSVEYKIIPDRIVAGTFLIAGLITRGKLKIDNIIPDHLKYPIKILKKMGAKIQIGKNYILLKKSSVNLKPIKIKTSPYPGFPTDLQAQFMTLLTIVRGKSHIQENIFENRFMHVSELNRLGANIKVKKDKSIIEGVKKLIGANVMASDLRASVSLILAGLVAEGKTVISRIYHLDRGYEKIEDKLNSCGSNIKRYK